jgi:hypothetical protein
MLRVPLLTPNDSEPEMTLPGALPGCAQVIILSARIRIKPWMHGCYVLTPKTFFYVNKEGRGVKCGVSMTRADKLVHEAENYASNPETQPTTDPSSRLPIGVQSFNENPVSKTNFMLLMNLSNDEIEDLTTGPNPYVMLAFYSLFFAAVGAVPGYFGARIAAHDVHAGASHHDALNQAVRQVAFYAGIGPAGFGAALSLGFAPMMFMWELAIAGLICIAIGIGLAGAGAASAAMGVGAYNMGAHRSEHERIIASIITPALVLAGGTIIIGLCCSTRLAPSPHMDDVSDRTEDDTSREDTSTQFACPFATRHALEERAAGNRLAARGPTP